jgi:hypothetical protein
MTHAVATLFFGINPLDPFTIAAAASLMAAIALGMNA